MAFFRSLVKSLISQSSKTLNYNPSSSSSRSFFTLCSASQPSIYYSPRIINNPFLFHQHHYNFRRHFLFPLSSTLGPLFLSSPPWKLSQSATPLLLCDVVSINLPKVRSALNFPYKLGLQSTRKLLKEDAKKTNSNGDNTREFIAFKLTDTGSDAGGAVRVTDSYLNLPNFISFSRLLSGPLLGWYTFYFFSPSDFLMSLSFNFLMHTMCNPLCPQNKWLRKKTWDACQVLFHLADCSPSICNLLCLK